MSGSSPIHAKTAEYCFLDLDFNNFRQHHGKCAAFVAATNNRYGFSSQDIRCLGGSELQRIPECMSTDHEWSQHYANLPKDNDDDAVYCCWKPPPQGNRIVVQLYWDVAPMACQNFATLCANGSSTHPSYFSNNKNNKKTQVPSVPIGESGKPLMYRNCPIHRIISNFVLQGGDIVLGNGSGGESIYGGKKFKDERAGLALEHNRRGILSMGNSGKHSNTSQFFITLDNVSAKCNGKHVVFGHVVSGWSILDFAAQNAAASDNDGTPRIPVIITDCGIVHPFFIPTAGYWLDRPDSESYSGISPVFMVRPRVALVAPQESVVQKFRQLLSTSHDVWHAITTTNNNNVVEQVHKLLSTFAIDVVIVAPASKGSLKDMTLPDIWKNNNNIDISQVVLEAKPIDALKAVRTRSWIAKAAKENGWELDGTTS